MEPHTSLLMKLSKSLKCSICFEIFTDPATSSCGQHNYCLQCLKAQYEGRAKSCPACREEFHKDYRPQKNITLCDIVGVVPRSTWDDMLTFSEHEDLQSSVEGTEAADGAEENLQTLKRKLTLLITEIERLDEILSKKCKLKQEYQDTAWGESNEHVNQSASYHLTGSEDGSLHGLSELPDLRLDSVTGSLRLGLECLTHALSELEQLDAPSQNGDAELIEREGLQGDSHPATAAVAWQQQNAERSLERPVSPFPPEGDQSESQSWSQGGSMELEAGGAEAGPAAVDDWLEHLTFSSQLAHKYLSFSGDNRRVQVRRRNLGRPSPSRRDRFGLSQVMTDQVFSSGVHYWEVDTSGSVGWAIGVAYDDLGRDDKLGRTSSSWCLEWSSNKLCFWHDNSSEQIKYGCPARYGELATGRRPVGHPALRFKDVCKRDLKLTGIDTGSWEVLAADCDGWRHAVSTGVKRGEEKRILQLEERRVRRKVRQQNVAANLQSDFVCTRCGRDCHARIGLLSRSRRCSQQV